MLRTIISIEKEEKDWLDREAKRRGVTMTQLVRDALKAYRQQHVTNGDSLESLLAKTHGIWEQEDGLTYQQSLRDEW